MKYPLIRRTWRIGVLTLWVDGTRYFVSCRNQTYEHMHEVSAEKLARWYELVDSGL